MKFTRPSKNPLSTGTLPPELVGKWLLSANGQQYEISHDDRYFVYDSDIPYSLIDAGMTLVHNGTRYNRIFGAPTEVIGVWQLEEDPSDEWNFRADGSYTYYSPGQNFFGTYTTTATTISTVEFRAALTESAGVLSFDPPFNPTVAAPWALAEPELTLHFPSGSLVYTRV
ncbi:MAG: hypothetical protein ACPG32_15705 [Akkermansiaceae bacterium]